MSRRERGGVRRSAAPVSTIVDLADRALVEASDVRCEVVPADGGPAVTVGARRVVRRCGRHGGHEVTLVGEHGLFTIEQHHDPQGDRSTPRVTVGELAGRPVAQVHAVVGFLDDLRRRGAALRVQPPWPSPSGVHLQPMESAVWDEASLSQVTQLGVVVETLASLQQHAPAVIRVPELDPMTKRQVVDWFVVAAILRGDRLTTMSPEGEVCAVDLLDAPAGEDDRSGALPLAVTVGRQVVDTGRRIRLVPCADPIEARGPGARILAFPRAGSARSAR